MWTRTKALLTALNFAAAIETSHVSTQIHDFGKALATGLCVLHGREPIVSFPKWGIATPDQPKMAIAVVDHGELRPFELREKSIDAPDATGDPQKDLVCVQSLYCTHDSDAEYLWILDSGRSPMEKGKGAPKLLQVKVHEDGHMGDTVRVYPLPDVEGAYLNDVRLDGKGFAYLTESNKGAIVVLELETGKSQTWVDERMQPFIEEVDQFKIKGRDMSFFKVAVDGIAYSGVDDQLYWKPVTKRNLYRVSAALLRAGFERASFEEASAGVEDLGNHGFHDGLDADSEGNVYLTDLSNGAIQMRKKDGTVSLISDAGAMEWPDAVITLEHSVFVLTTQVHLLPFLNEEMDLRQKGNELLLLEPREHHGTWAKRHHDHEEF